MSFAAIDGDGVVGIMVMADNGDVGRQMGSRSTVSNGHGR